VAKKFIPDGDSDFAWMARGFVNAIARHPARYQLPESDVAEMMRAVVAFRSALAANRHRRTKSMNTVARKGETRKTAEVLIRAAANRLRADRNITVIDRHHLGMKERPARLRPRTCPDTAPVMQLLGAKPGSPLTPGKVVIQFFAGWEKSRRRRPEGATHLDLYMMLLPPGAPIPTTPLDRNGWANGHVGAFPRSPLRVDAPSPNAPMQLVCWGRWAANGGKPSRFSAPLQAGFVGCPTGFTTLPAPQNAEPETERVGHTVIITSARRELPDCVETIDTLRTEPTRMLPDRQADAA
jgi:hypothetical protein